MLALIYCMQLSLMGVLEYPEHSPWIRHWISDEAIIIMILVSLLMIPASPAA